LSSDTAQADFLDAAKLPRHVAIIMDGNGRWAAKRLLNRVKGHEKGAETVRSIARACRELNISILTLYAFSTENWLRPKREIAALMNLLNKFLISEEPELRRNAIRLGIIGQPQRLPDYVQSTIQRVMDSTAQNDGMLLNLALSYGGRTEILEMVQAVARKVAAGTLSPDAIDADLIADHLYTRNLPDPDLLIRTSGEMRISNFLLWQLAYTEFFATATLWPDFSREEFIDILGQYQRRDRRFGKVKG
jgi:undecaprenyl diphosphate synthase